MDKPKFIYIIIATSMHRTDWLLTRSLPSVYAQLNVNKEDVSVLVIDDNEIDVDSISSEYFKIESGVQKLRKQLDMESNQFPTQLLTNIKTRGNSGTGAWNTGIEYAHRNSPNSYISILDDDDEYLPFHLYDCLEQVARNPETDAVFQRLIWRSEDGSVMDHPLKTEQLTPQRFFVGNPGVQGSNMFIKTKRLVEIGGFDEQFPNTTDRDLMIRFLWHIAEQRLGNSPLQYVSVIEKIGVIHHNHTMGKVNNNFGRKQIGLELFYRKYRQYFSASDFEQSLARARNFFKFQYPSSTYE